MFEEGALDSVHSYGDKNDAVYSEDGDDEKEMMRMKVIDKIVKNTQFSRG